MRDTSDSALVAQVEAMRRLGPAGRVRAAAELSEAMLRISIEGAQRRHPEYTAEEARRSVLSAVWGDALASRVWSKSALR